MLPRIIGANNQCVKGSASGVFIFLPSIMARSELSSTMSLPFANPPPGPPAISPAPLLCPVKSIDPNCDDSRGPEADVPLSFGRVIAVCVPLVADAREGSSPIIAAMMSCSVEAEATIKTAASVGAAVCCSCCATAATDGDRSRAIPLRPPPPPLMLLAVKNYLAGGACKKIEGIMWLWFDCCSGFW